MELKPTSFEGETATHVFNFGWTMNGWIVHRRERGTPPIPPCTYVLTLGGFVNSLKNEAVCRYFTTVDHAVKVATGKMP